MIIKEVILKQNRLFKITSGKKDTLTTVDFLFRFLKERIGKKIVIYVEDLKEGNDSLSGFNASYYGTISLVSSTHLIIETNARRKEKHILCWGLIKYIKIEGD